jgi:hypothetical protein
MNCVYTRTDNLRSADTVRCPYMMPLVFGDRHILCREPFWLASSPFFGNPLSQAAAICR